MSLQILLAVKPIADFLCRHPSVYGIRLGVMCHDTSCCDDCSVRDVHTAHHYRSKSDPHVIAYHGHLPTTFPVIFLVTNAAGQPHCCSHLLVVMVVTSYNPHMVSKNHPVAYPAVRLYYRVFPDIEVVTDGYLIPCPEEYPPATVESLPYVIPAPHDVLVPQVTQFFDNVHN